MTSNSSLSEVKFWLLLVLSIPSVACSILILIHLYKQGRNLSIHHHLTLLLIIISLVQITTQLPLSMAFFKRGEVIPATGAFCTWWAYWEYSLNGMSRFIMAWGSIERHILIFNIALMATRTKRFIFHIFPMLIISIYPFIFYFAVVAISPCNKYYWDYQVFLCRVACYVIEQANLFIFDLMFTTVFPVLVILIANLFLVYRVVYRKRRHQGEWRRQRKLTKQLFGVASVYIICWFPVTFTGVSLNVTHSAFVGQIQSNYFTFLPEMIPVLLPFILLGTLPELMKKLINKQQRTIAPVPNVN